MNILLSYNWLKEFIDTKKSPQELEDILSLHSMSVEKVMTEVELLSDLIVLGEIKEVKPHPDADKLKLAVVTDGKEDFNVVCGAPNIKEGMKIAFAKTGSMVKWHGEGDPVELKPAKIRGIESFGMICDDSEVGLAKHPNPVGITDYSHLKAKPGTPMSKALNLDDTVLEVEITTNRIDAASVNGMARELAAITGEKYKYQEAAEPGKPETKLPLKITIEDKEKCLGFNGIVLTDVKVGPSPEWLQRRLRAAGHSSFNNVVDITNYVMRELGHPLHAFDYDKVKDGHLIIREAKKKEKMAMLDETEIELDPLMVVVADKDQALSLGGVMGGASSMITEETNTVLLEAASWNIETIRKTMMKLDKFSDAGLYFNKGVSPQLSQEAIKRAIQLIIEVTGAKVASPLVSEGYAPYKPASVEMNFSQAEKYIGSELDKKKVVQQLESLGFASKLKGETVVCEVPHWRQYDVAIEEDLIEEVARLYGYHNIANKLPSGEIPFPEFDKQLKYEDDVKDLMKGMGYTELYTYSMVSEELHKLGEFKVDEALRLLNPLDDNHVVMRTHLMPSVLEIAAQNQGVVSEQKLFEITNVYIPNKKGQLPTEVTMMAGVSVGYDLEKMFRDTKGVVKSILKYLGLNSVITESSSGNRYEFKMGDDFAGYVKIVSLKEAKALGLKQDAVAFMLPFETLVEKANPHMTFNVIPKFPSIELDLSFSVDSSTPWGDVEQVVRQAGGELLCYLELFDIYDPGEGRKSFAFHMEYRDDKKTLEMKDIEPIKNNIISTLEKELKAELRK